MSFLLVAVDLLTLVVTLSGLHGPVRFLLGVTLGLFVPGWSVVGLLKLRNAALELALSVGGSLATLTAAAQILMTVHAWHLSGLEVAMCLVCLPSLVWQSRNISLMARSK